MIVYSPIGEELCEVKDFKLNANLMGQSTITATKFSSSKIDFKVGSYVELDGQQYHIYFPKPNALKTSKTDIGVGDALQYTLIFYSPQRKLEDIGFFDYVPGWDDSDIYFTGSSEVIFYGTIDELVGRISANLERYYSDQQIPNPWNIGLAPEFVAKVESGEIILGELSIATSKASCWEALQIAYDQFNIEFRVYGYEISVGFEGEVAPFSFEYGRDKGLRNIQLAYDESEKLVTRLRVSGSDQNLPEGYRDEDLGVATNVKLPKSWGKDYIDIDWNYDPMDPETFIWRTLKEEYGIIEGSREPYDIKPSIEGAVDSFGRPLDEIVTGTTSSLSEDAASFILEVNNPGFNPFDITPAGSTPVISIKSQRADGNSAKLGGYKFNIISASISGNILFLNCARNTEEPTALPSQSLTLDAGDKFVYLGISMPDEYVIQAENKVLDKGKQDIHSDNGLAFQYSMEPSSLFLHRNPDALSVLRVGNKIPMIDEDLGIDGQPIKIQSLDISYGSAELPQYSMTLADIKYKTLRDSIRISGQNQDIYNQIIKNDLRSNTNITNIIGGETPTWEIRE